MMEGSAPSVTGLGIVADLIAVVTFLFGAWKAIPAIRSWLESRRHRNVSSFVQRVSNDQGDARAILKNLAVAILDDEPASFPVEHVKSIAGSLDLLTSIRLADTSTLTRFDVLFLDIAGVVVEDPKNGGVEVLKRLKEQSPNKPIVIAVSSKNFKPETNRFFRLADDVLNKPLSPADTEEALLALVQDRMTQSGLARKLDSLLDKTNLSAASHAKAITRTVRYLSGRKDIAWLRTNVTAAFAVGQSNEFEAAAESLKRIQANAR